MKVCLRDEITGQAVASDITGAAGGGFTFYGVPAGLYEFSVVGPWAVRWSNAGQYWLNDELVVRDGENGSPQHTFFVEPGPDVPDLCPTAPSPPPQASPSVGLAATGANVAWLALGGLLTLVVGAGLVLGTTRRRPGPSTDN